MFNSNRIKVVPLEPLEPSEPSENDNREFPKLELKVKSSSSSSSNKSQSEKSQSDNDKINPTLKIINQEETIYELSFTIYNGLNLFIDEHLLPYYLDNYSIINERITSKYQHSINIISTSSSSSSSLTFRLYLLLKKNKPFHIIIN